MRAAIVNQQGLLEIVEMDEPTPQPDEVVIRVHTVGINQLDLNVLNGTGPGSHAQRPRVFGIDPAGEIIAQGSEVRIDRVGERVVVKPNISCGSCEYCRSGEAADCPRQSIVGVHRDGGAAEFVSVPARNAFDIGDLDFRTATVSVHSVPIALHAIESIGAPRSHESVVVTGSSGGVGSAAAQLAARSGAKVVTVARSQAPDGHPFEHVTYSHLDDLSSALADSAPYGFDALVDATGHAGVAGAAIGALGWRGRAAICSASVSSELTVDARHLYLKRIRLFGVASANYDQVARALALVGSGDVSVRAGSTFDLRDIRDALAGFEAGNTGGKITVQLR